MIWNIFRVESGIETHPLPGATGKVELAPGETVAFSVSPVFRVLAKDVPPNGDFVDKVYHYHINRGQLLIAGEGRDFEVAEL